MTHQQQRRRREGGSVSIWLVTTGFAMIVLVGLAVDLGGQVHAQQQARAVAGQAARAGGQQLQGGPAVRGDAARTDTTRAATAARAFLASAHVTGTVAVTGGTTVTVTTTDTYPTTFLGVIGISTLTVTGHAQARSGSRRARSRTVTTLRTRLVGLAATVATLALVAGFPALLIAIDATPVPTSVPTWDTVVTALTSRDDGTLTLRVLAVVAWGGWAFLTLTIALDVWARLRRMRAPTLPGLALPQSAAHTLVGAAVLLFAAAPTLAPTTPAAAAPPPAATAQPWHATTDPVAGAPSPTAHRNAAPRSTADTSPLRHDPAHRHRGGVAVEHRPRPPRRPHPLRADRSAERARPERGPGPDPPRHHPDPARRRSPRHHHHRGPGRYTVQRGDTLSGIAHDTLGDAGRYREILDASRDTTQPGGAHLVDPDVIDVGWTLTIPTPRTSDQPAAGPTGDAGQATPARPGHTRAARPATTADHAAARR